MGEKLMRYPLMESSYCKRNCSKEEIIEFLKTTEKKILYTYGFKFRSPTTRDVPISNERAVEIFNSEYCDVEEKEDYVDLNAFSSNDLY